jgi:GxxExxY protein
MLYEELSKKIVHAAHLVHDELHFGFLEAVYGNALYKELSRMGLNVSVRNNWMYSIKVRKLAIMSQTWWLKIRLYWS